MYNFNSRVFVKINKTSNNTFYNLVAFWPIQSLMFKRVYMLLIHKYSSKIKKSWKEEKKKMLINWGQIWKSCIPHCKFQSGIAGGGWTYDETHYQISRGLGEACLIRRIHRVRQIGKRWNFPGPENGAVGITEHAGNATPLPFQIFFFTKWSLSNL